MNSTCNRFIYIYSVLTPTHWNARAEKLIVSLCPMTFTSSFFSAYTLYTHIYRCISSTSLYIPNVNWNAQTRIDTSRFKQRRPFQKKLLESRKRIWNIFKSPQCLYKSMAIKKTVSIITQLSLFRSNKLHTMMWIFSLISYLFLLLVFRFFILFRFFLCCIFTVNRFVY